MHYEKNIIPSKKNPLSFSLLTILTYFLIEIVVFKFLKHYFIFNFINNQYVFEIINSLANITIIIVIVFLFKFWAIYSIGSFKKSFKYTAVFIIFYFSIFAYDIIFKIQNKTNFKPFSGIVAGLLDLFLTGFGEESIFRGIVANSLALKYAKNKTGVYFSVIISGLMFGCAHIVNILSGVNIINGIMQILTASIIGMFLTAAYFRGRNIWPLIILHCVIDSASLLNFYFVKNYEYVEIVNEYLTASDFIYFLINITIYILATLFLLRNRKIYEIINNFK